MTVRAYDDVASFEDRALPWLVRREAEHNLLLGLLPRLRSGAHDFGQPIYLAVVELDGEVAGCAFRTPPFKLGLTRLPEASIAPLVEHVAVFYSELPAVLGPEAGTMRFAELWCKKRGTRSFLGARQRIHSLERVTLPASDPAGSLRAAEASDLPQLAAWIGAFSRETGTDDPGTDAAAKAGELLRNEAVYVWDDGEPRSMVAVPGETPRGVRVGYVYTPPPLRGRGLASSAVATLSDRLLRGGRRFCFLYTDLANPTSNAIYQRIGYQPVCDVVDVRLEPGG